MKTAMLKDHFASCQRCNYCRWLPVPKSYESSYVCPSIQFGGNFAYSGGGKMMLGYGILDGKIDYSPEVLDGIYACTTCGGCDVACKTNLADMVEPLSAMYEVRRKCVEDDQLPPGLRVVLGHLAEHGNAGGADPSTRATWTTGLDLPRRGRTLLHVGDAAFDVAQWEALRFAAAELRAAGEDVAVGGEDEPDCGALAFDIGDWPLARAFAERTVAWIRATGAARVVTCSDTAFMAFRAVYPRLDVAIEGVEIVHITQWLADRISGAAADRSEVVTYHDACRLGRLSEPFVPWRGEWVTAYNSLPMRTQETPVRFGTGGVYDAPRALLAASGVALVEMERIREFAYCCGAGGGAPEANPRFARNAGLERLNEAVRTGAATMVTSCGGCARHMGRLADEAGLPIRVVTLLDHLRTMPPTGAPQESPL